ncbi:DEAD/DEAH box helicase, partial [Streptomyces sp. MCAF7]
PYAVTARELRALPARARVALTGTPVENNLSELWALLDWTTPGLLGPLSGFRDRHARAIESGEEPEAAARLSRLIRPFLLRRRKSDPGIAPELPAKTETDRVVPLTTEQAGLYEAVVRETMAKIAEAEGIARRGLVLKLLTALKQICNHPAQYLRQSHPLRGRSGKLDLLDELIGTITAEGESMLVFTQYKQMANLLEKHLAERCVPTLFLHGATPVARREEMVERFQRGEVPVFLLSLKADPHRPRTASRPRPRQARLRRELVGPGMGDGAGGLHSGLRTPVPRPHLRPQGHGRPDHRHPGPDQGCCPGQPPPPLPLLGPPASPHRRPVG